MQDYGREGWDVGFGTATVGHETTVARVEIKLRVEISSVRPSFSALRRCREKELGRY